jgi:hypothetical protein
MDSLKDYINNTAVVPIVLYVVITLFIILRYLSLRNKLIEKGFTGEFFKDAYSQLSFYISEAKLFIRDNHKFIFANELNEKSYNKMVMDAFNKKKAILDFLDVFYNIFIILPLLVILALIIFVFVMGLRNSGINIELSLSLGVMGFVGSIFQESVYGTLCSIGKLFEEIKKYKI